MLEIRSVMKRFGSVVALEEVSLDVAAGEFLGLLGPNGAGKSTLLSLIAACREPDRGKLRLAGKTLSPANAAARASLGFMPQTNPLYDELTAEENLRVFGELHGLRGLVLRERIKEALEAVQLSVRRRYLLKNCSDGMRRRVALAASILHRPKLLLCDEPVAGIDPESHHAILGLLEALNRDGLTIVYATHSSAEASRLCSRIALMDQGKILALGTLDELLNQIPFEEEIGFPVNPTTENLATELIAHGEIASSGDTLRFRPRADFAFSKFYALAETLGLPPRFFTHGRRSLDALFAQLTGRSLRK